MCKWMKEKKKTKVNKATRRNEEEEIFFFGSTKWSLFLLLIFFLIWIENFLVGLRRKYLDPTIYFLSSLLN